MSGLMGKGATYLTVGIEAAELLEEVAIEADQIRGGFSGCLVGGRELCLGCSIAGKGWI
jgi:hypothetical protein